jgi:O-antigen ligase
MILIILSAYFLATLSFIPEYLQSIFRKIFPENLIKAFEFSKITNILNEPRIYIYQNTLPIIMERPLLGWGAASFPILFNERYLDFKRDPTHPHNLILEMGNSYGLIFALIISLSIIIILYLSFKMIFIRKKRIINNKINNDINSDKAWWSSFFALFLSQMYDVQYFDFRISISFWILLTGLICILESKFYANLVNE